MSKLEKRYQVFVSSTYEDLIEERQEVMHALLELDCIPAGMELFPAADEDQWTLIKRVIDDCDYYIVIIGGRYGSVDKDGISYTEKEYRYALEKGKSIIAFLHESPDDLPGKKLEKSEVNRKKLEEFRELVQNKMTKTWTNAKDLNSVVTVSLVKLMKRSPAIGWVRADVLPSDDLTAELLKLRKRIEELETDLEIERKEPPKDSERYAQGDQYTLIKYSFSARNPKGVFNVSYKATIYLTWNDLFSCISPSMLDENVEYNLIERVNSYIKEKVYRQKSQDFENPQNFRINEESFESIIVQFYTLGLIEKSKKKHTPSDTNKYWSLSEFGEHTMMRLRAVKNVEYFEGELPEIERKVVIEIQRAINDSIMELPELEYSDNGYIGKENVKELSISSKELNYLPETISDLAFLNTLQIHNTMLEYIPKSIFKLSKLKILDLSDNQIKFIPENMGELKVLEELDLSVNSINRIPDSIGNLVNLKILDLFLNQIEYFPNSIEKLKNLEKLSISFNNIDKFPDCISTLKQLKDLTIQSNKFSEIPESIFQLSNLEELWMECNEVLSIPSSIAQLKNLTDLTIMCRKLNELPIEIGELSNLKYLDISECSLSTIPESLLNLSKLENLRIEDNEIRPLTDQIEGVLKKLELQGCKIAKEFTESED